MYIVCTRYHRPIEGINEDLHGIDGWRRPHGILRGARDF